MPYYAITIIFGTGLAFYGNQLPDLYWATLLPILLWLAFCNRECRFLLLLTASYLWASALLNHHLQFQLTPDFDNRIALVRGIIVDIPEIDAGRVRISLKVIEIDGYQNHLPRLIRLNWYQDKVIPGSGEFWQFEAKLRRPDGFLNPGGFDYEAWQFSKGIDARGYIRGSKLNYKLGVAPLLSLDRWRSRLSERIDQSCSECSNPGIIKALILGYRGDIKNSQWDRLQASGTAHLIAISGLHIGMIAALFYGLGRWLWRFGFYSSGLSRNLTASLLALLAALVYAAMAGFSLPTVRALVMLATLFVASLSRNRINLLQSLSLAIIFILIMDPRVIGSTSFWLSISAVLIIAFTQFRFASIGAGFRLVVLQLNFSLVFIPLGILFFDQVNPASFAANIVAIPVVSIVILPLILVASSLVPVSDFLSHYLFVFADTLLEFLMQYLGWLMVSGFNSIAVAQWPTLLALALLLFPGTFLVPVTSGIRKLSILLLLVLVFWQPEKLEWGDYEVTAFEVGMGTSILVRTRNHSLVYDFGPGNSNGYSAADQALIPYLQRNSIEMPDLLVVSHVDQDHSGGFRSYLDSYQPNKLLSGTPVELRKRFALGHRVLSCHEQSDWSWDGIRFRFLNVASAVVGSTNNRSCILKVEGHQVALLPGDIDVDQEKRLIRKYGVDLKAEILVAPHHGSASSSSREFVKQVNPDHVIFTLSRGNRWGFPRQEVVSRYQSIGSHLFRNDKDGAIQLQSSKSGIQVRVSRATQNRIWRRW
jgi:competence protein ComEC